jgi:hypothetical protein
MQSAGLTRNAREDMGLEQLAPKLKCTRSPLAIDMRVNMAYPHNNGLLVLWPSQVSAMVTATSAIMRKEVRGPSIQVM